MPVGKTHSVRFEVSVEKKLTNLAAVSNKTVSEQIREIVSERVNDGEADYIRHRLHQVENQLVSLRQDFATAVEALMVINISNSTLTKDEIKAWVQENLFKKG